MLCPHIRHPPRRRPIAIHPLLRRPVPSAQAQRAPRERPTMRLAFAAAAALMALSLAAQVRAQAGQAVFAP